MSDFTEMNKESDNEIKENRAISVELQTDSNLTEKIGLVSVSYGIINILYFLLFLASLGFAACATGFNDYPTEETTMQLNVIYSFPIIIISSIVGARYFYRQGKIITTFLILLLPPLLIGTLFKLTF
jgi:hypothetical protein